jgi:hypothetical protein
LRGAEVLAADFVDGDEHGFQAGFAVGVFVQFQEGDIADVAVAEGTGALVGGGVLVCNTALLHTALHLRGELGFALGQGCLGVGGDVFAVGVLAGVEVLREQVKAALVHGGEAVLQAGR